MNMGDTAMAHEISMKNRESLLVEQEAQDITAPKYRVEIQISYDSKVVRIHVDGQTVLRISQIPRLILIDDRK